MYACYRRNESLPDVTRYAFKEQVSLFGIHQGFITWLLRHQLGGSESQPCTWHVDVRASMARHPEYAECSLLIDLKPKKNKTNLSLYEVLDVWGYSSNDWTPVLLRLNGLFVDADPSSVNRNDFQIKKSETDGPIYEFLYLGGTIVNGNLSGRWSPPPVSPTNAALLWPDAMRYFIQCIHSKDPELVAP